MPVLYPAVVEGTYSYHVIIVKNCWPIIL
jgi:hypothetical protein